ncbi:MAG: hypothetical protein VX641_07115 [Planctomycetota bacterium]|nr:hypothetical protein [Planctomycetota bacterium]
MVWTAAFLLLVGPFVGCASPSATSPVRVTTLSDPLSEVPQDFEVEVLVMVGRKVPDRTVLQRRNVSMLLLPDGSLHAATGTSVVAGTRPGLARTLYQDQVAELWALLGRLDLRTAGTAPLRPVRPPGAMEIVYVIEVTQNNQRRRIVDRLVKDETNRAMVAVIRSMGGLAWLRDEAPPPNLVEPVRYDFGPDPWARYRTTSKSAEREQ